jgi:hypothetical protein
MARQSSMPAFLAGFACCWLIVAVFVGAVGVHSGLSLGAAFNAATGWPTALVRMCRP